MAPKTIVMAALMLVAGCFTEQSPPGQEKTSDRIWNPDRNTIFAQDDWFIASIDARPEGWAMIVPWRVPHGLDGDPGNVAIEITPLWSPGQAQAIRGWGIMAFARSQDASWQALGGGWAETYSAMDGGSIFPSMRPAIIPLNGGLRAGDLIDLVLYAASASREEGAKVELAWRALPWDGQHPPPHAADAETFVQTRGSKAPYGWRFCADVPCDATLGIFVGGAARVPQGDSEVVAFREAGIVRPLPPTLSSTSSAVDIAIEVADAPYQSALAVLLTQLPSQSHWRAEIRTGGVMVGAPSGASGAPFPPCAVLYRIEGDFGISRDTSHKLQLARSGPDPTAVWVALTIALRHDPEGPALPASLPVRNTSPSDAKCVRDSGDLHVIEPNGPIWTWIGFDAISESSQPDHSFGTERNI